MRRGLPGHDFAETWLVFVRSPPTMSRSRQAVPGGGAFLWRLRCSAWGRARLRASLTDSSQLFERSALGARSEFCDADPRPSIAAESERSGDRHSMSPRRVPPAATRGLASTQPVAVGHGTLMDRSRVPCISEAASIQVSGQVVEPAMTDPLSPALTRGLAIHEHPQFPRLRTRSSSRWSSAARSPPPPRGPAAWCCGRSRCSGPHRPAGHARTGACAPRRTGWWSNAPTGPGRWTA